MALDLKLADLWQPCEKCKGTGRYTAPPPPRGPHELVMQSGYSGDCDECDGVGVGGKPTDPGKALLAFLNKAGYRR